MEARYDNAKKWEVVPVSLGCTDLGKAVRIDKEYRWDPRVENRMAQKLMNKPEAVVGFPRTRLEVGREADYLFDEEEVLGYLLDAAQILDVVDQNICE